MSPDSSDLAYTFWYIIAFAALTFDIAMLGHPVPLGAVISLGVCALAYIAEVVFRGGTAG